jgi:hypothetical protein
MALRFSGLFMMSQVMPSSFSMSTVSYLLLGISLLLVTHDGIDRAAKPATAGDMASQARGGPACGNGHGNGWKR